MAMTVESAIADLRRSVPSFVPNPELEPEGLHYPMFNDFARYICSEAEVLQYAASREEATRLSRVPDCMMFLERAFLDGDSTVRDLVLECVESLSECPWRDQIKPWAGPGIAAHLKLAS